MSLVGRLDTVTNGRFQVSEFNDSFRAMNLKSGRSPGDPLQTLNPDFRMAAVNGKRTIDSNETIRSTRHHHCGDAKSPLHFEQNLLNNIFIHFIC
jgi:hypothetical protein